MRRVVSIALSAVLAVLLVAAPARSASAAAAPSCTAAHWVAAWAAVPTDAATGGFQAQTVRQVLVPHMAGRRVRLRLSNRFGAEPLTVDATTLGRQASGRGRRRGHAGAGHVRRRPQRLDPAGWRGGQRPRADRRDRLRTAARLPVLRRRHRPADRALLRAPDAVRRRGDRAGAAAADGFSALEATSSYVVSGLEVQAPGSVGSVVTFGDSLSDGYEASPAPGQVARAPIGADESYPDELQRRLLTARGDPRLAVVSAGISGNRILADGLIAQHGVSALGRIDADALRQAGVTTVIVQMGANDIGNGGVDAAHIIAGLSDLVARVRAAGLRVVLGTLTPAEGARPASYGDGIAEATRAAVNAWIRSGRRRRRRRARRLRRGAARPVVARPAEPRLRLRRRPAPQRRGLPGDGAARSTSPSWPPPAAPARRAPPLTVRVPSRYRKRLVRATVTLDGRRVGTITRRHAKVRVSFAQATARPGRRAHAHPPVRRPDGHAHPAAGPLHRLTARAGARCAASRSAARSGRC